MSGTLDQLLNTIIFEMPPNDGFVPICRFQRTERSFTEVVGEEKAKASRWPLTGH
jgi:hypothetical protein